MAKALPPVEQMDVAKFFTDLEDNLRARPAASDETVGILATIDLLREAYKSGDIDLALSAALCLGFRLVHGLSEPGRIGLAVEDGAKRGGEARGGSKNSRDIEMASEFQAKRSSAKCSDSALKAKIGKAHGLESRSQAIQAINKGLKKLSG